MAITAGYSRSSRNIWHELLDVEIHDDKNDPLTSIRLLEKTIVNLC